MQTNTEKANSEHLNPGMRLSFCLAEKSRMNAGCSQITLPYPIIANRYWRTFQPRGFRTPVTVVSPEAKAYKEQVAKIAWQSGFRGPISGRVSVHLKLYPKRPRDWKKREMADPNGWDQSVKCLDIDNARKVLYDALGGVLFEDDRWIWSDSAERKVPDGEPRVEVTVSRWG